MCGVGVSEDVRGDAFVYSGFLCGLLDVPAEGFFMDVMPPYDPCPWIFGEITHGEQKLLLGLKLGIGVFALQRIGQIDTAVPLGNIFLMQLLHMGYLYLQALL